MYYRQRGVAMIEILGALLIAAMLVAGLTAMIETALEDAKAQRAAQYQTAMTRAASTYLADQYGALAVPANVGQTLAISPAMLKAAGVLPPGMESANPYGQSGCLLVRPRLKHPITKFPVPPNPIVLDAVVVSEGPAIPDRVLGVAAASAGAGYINSLDPTRARAASGAWRLDAGTSPSLDSFTAASCSGTAAAAGSLVSALFFDGPGQSADFLYRNQVPGLPELNQMNAPIGMGAAAVVVAEDACSGAGIAVDANRNLMHCTSDNRWRQVAAATSWRAPVDTYADLAAQPDSNDGDVRLVKDKGLAFGYAAATGTWRPLAVDQNGNLDMSGTLTAGADVNAGRDLTAGRNGKIGDDLEVHDHIHGYTLIVDDYIWAWTYSIGSHFWPGDGCNKVLPGTNPPIRVNIIGTIVLDSSSPPLPLICTGTDPDNAVWKYINGSLTR